MQCSELELTFSGRFVPVTQKVHIATSEAWSFSLYRHLKLEEQAALIDKAITKTLSMDKIHTKDLGGDASSSDVMDNVIAHIKKQL